MLQEKPQTKNIFDGLKHAPQEDNPEIGPIIRAISQETKEKIHRKYDLLEGAYILTIGREIWAEQKRILLKERGIDWKTPAEMNPGAMIN